MSDTTTTQIPSAPRTSAPTPEQIHQAVTTAVNRKSFTTYKPTEIVEFEVNGERFKCVPMVPGAVLLDFLSQVGSNDAARMAAAVGQLLDAAIHPDDKERWTAFIRDPENAVGLTTLAEIAGFVADKLSSVDPTQQPDGLSSTG